MKKEENYYRIRQSIFQIKGELDYIELYAQKQRKKLEELDNFLSEQEQPEVDLEKEIIRYQREDMDRDTTVGNVARHFFELGQRRAAEMYDEIEYNRQRAEEEMSDKTLDEAADNFVWKVMENDEEGISDLCRKLRPSSIISDFYDALGEFFKAGAKWMAGQGYTTEETVYYERLCDETRIMVDFGRDGERGGFNPGDKVIVQIRKKEESK